MRFPIVKSKGARNRKLEVACYSQEPHPLPDQLLGKAVIDLAEIIKTGEFDGTNGTSSTIDFSLISSITEWVELDVDGVQRGEIYLEMTYYSNDPEPEKPSQPAAAPKNKILSNFLEVDSASLQRRPSKLSPAVRLSRPRQTSGSSFDPQPPGAYPSLSQPAQQQQVPNQGSTHHPSLTPSYGTSPQSRWDPLPSSSGPEIHESSLPALLRPGGGRTPPSSSPIPIPQLALPASYGNRQHSSPSPPSQSPYLGPQYGSPLPSLANLNPYIGGAASPAPPPIQDLPIFTQTSPHIQTGPSAALWRQDGYSTPILDSGIQGTGGFAIPISGNSGPQVQDPRSGMYSSPPPFGYGRNSRPTHLRAGSDPLLIARYSTPLPLPPGVTPRTHPVAPAPIPAPVSVPIPAPIPAPEIPPVIVPPVLPPRENKASPDSTRYEVLKRAEEEAKKKHDQELRDLELAMQLDRELNFS